MPPFRVRRSGFAVLIALSAPLGLWRCERLAPDHGELRFSEAMAVDGSSAGASLGKQEKDRPHQERLHRPPAFPWEGRFVDGIAPFAAPQGFGFRDSSGRMICGPRFAHACGFSEGRAPVHEGGKWGYLDASGNLAVPADYDWAGPFREGRAAVSSGGRFRFIDTAGNPVGALDFSDARPFSGGFAAVRFGNAEEGAWGFIDRAGNLAIPPGFADVPSGFSEGLAAVALGGDHGRRMGYIDTTGGFAMGSLFDAAGDFRNGLAPVGRGVFARGRFEGTWSYVDRDGARAFPGDFAWAGAFEHGAALARRIDGSFLLLAIDGSSIAESADSSSLADRPGRGRVAYELPAAGGP